MQHINQAIIVEGKYDKLRVERICDAPVFTTEGFRIFKSTEKREFLRRLAETRGIIILTDSDRAGFMIRNHIKGFIGEGNVVNAYIPEIKGKERRKHTPSAEGKLGVEGMEDIVIEQVLQKYAAKKTHGELISKTDLYDTGLYGGANSAAARTLLCGKLSVPTGISTDSFIDALNALMSKDEFLEMMGKENA